MSSSNQKLNNPHRSSDPNFDLDDYLEEKGHQENTDERYNEEPKTNNFLNRALLLIALVSAVAWSFNITKNTDWASLFGFGSSDVTTEAPVVVNIPPINIDIPEIEIDIPEINIGDNSADVGSVIEYLQELQNQGLLDTKISAFEAREVYNSGVPISYLLQLDQRGLLEELSFVEISEFYNGGVPFEYLQTIKDRGYEDRLSFVEITEFYQNDVSFDYLDLMDEAGYFDELSFVEMTEYYQNGVTPEFLDELKESGIYNSLSFIDVVEIYKSQN